MTEIDNPQEIFIKVPVSELPEIGQKITFLDALGNADTMVITGLDEETVTNRSYYESWLRPLTAHVFTPEQLQERDREIAGRAFDAARKMDYGSLPPIPDWIIRYDQANHQSSAGKAIRFLMQRIKELEQGRQ